MRKYLVVLLSLVLCVSAIGSVRALTINLDYTHDTYFYSNATAKATLEAAAADISSAITTSLAAINTDVYVGTNGSTTARFDWNYSYTNPTTTGASETIDLATIASDTVTIFVGVRNIPDTSLGVGGPSGIGVNLKASGLSSEWAVAVADGAAQSEAAYMRGSGPTIGNITGNSTWGGYTANYSIDYGAAYGSLWFDVDSDNNGVQDSPATLANYWHFDSTTPVVAGKNDLYTVALHEILHSLGIGSAESWDGLVSGTTWNGSEVQAITGSGADLVTDAGSHIAGSVMSTRLSDGGVQEVVMDPTITTGSRKELTLLDLAFLRDIGYETVQPSFAADFDGNGKVDGADLTDWQASFGVDIGADADADGDSDGADFLIWQQQFGSGVPTTVISIAVPEPSAAWLLLLGAACLPRKRRTDSGSAF